MQYDERVGGFNTCKAACQALDSWKVGRSENGGRGRGIVGCRE